VEDSGKEGDGVSWCDDIENGDTAADGRHDGMADGGEDGDDDGGQDGVGDSGDEVIMVT
jgi:hypothetical protein